MTLEAKILHKILMVLQGRGERGSNNCPKVQKAESVIHGCTVLEVIIEELVDEAKVSAFSRLVVNEMGPRSTLDGAVLEGKVDDAPALPDPASSG